MLLALTVMWGTAFLLTKVAVDELAPAVVVAGRLLIGAVLLAGLLIVLRRGLPGGRRHWLFFIAIAVVGNTLPFLLISWGQQAVDSGQAGILMAFMPLITLVLAHFALPDERLTWARAFGFLLGFAGVVILMGPQALLDVGHPGDTLAANLAILAGAACYAVASILARLKPAGDDVATAAATTLVATVVVLPWLALQTSPAAPDSAPAVSPGAWLAVLALGLFSTAIAAVVYFNLVKRAGASFVAQLNYLIPLWAVLIGIVFLGERPTAAHGFALLLILAGIFVSQRAQRPVARTNAAEAVAVRVASRSYRER